MHRLTGFQSKKNFGTGGKEDSNVFVAVLGGAGFVPNIIAKAPRGVL